MVRDGSPFRPDRNHHQARRGSPDRRPLPEPARRKPRLSRSTTSDSTGSPDEFGRYLAAKKAIDDRSLHERVWRTMVAGLPPARPDRPVRVLEVGAGIGTMIERLLDRQALSFADYRALDRDPHGAAAASSRLQAWAAARRLGWEEHGEDLWRIHGAGVDLQIQWTTGSLFEPIELPSDRDLILAHAFLDLVDLDRALPRLFATLAPEGLFYFTLTFDGLTAFLPEIEADLDFRIMEAYHASMDHRKEDGRPTAGSRAGRRLLQELQGRGARLLDLGSSDWLVFPDSTGYDPDEAAFLEAMVGFVEGAVGDDPRLDPGRLKQWLDRRRTQIRSGELSFLAHQIDAVGKIGPGA